MPFLTGKIYCVVAVTCIALAIMGCRGGESREDIPPVDTSTAPQAAPDVTDAPTPTLAREISEPISPVSPVSPIEKPAMRSDEQGVEPIKGSESALTAAKADLAQQTGISVDEIKLVSMEAVEWSDASLGCPQEGFMYAQVITPGYLMILEAQGEQYEYHTDTTTNVVLCQQ